MRWRHRRPRQPARRWSPRTREEGRRVIVTGAAGLGRQIANQLPEAGAHVLLGDLDLAAADKATDELNAGRDPRRAIGGRVDVADHGSVEALADLAVAWLGGSKPGLTTLESTRVARSSTLSGTRGEGDGHQPRRRLHYSARAAAGWMVSSGTRGVIVNMSRPPAFDGANGATTWCPSTPWPGSPSPSRSNSPSTASDPSLSPHPLPEPGVQADMDTAAGETRASGRRR
jgi:hypothetical protein